jgi:hypothetical protein
MAESVSIWLVDEPNGPNPRHRYVVHIAFEIILGCKVHWAKSRHEWLSSEHRKIQYGGQPTTDQALQILWIPASGLLRQHGTAVSDWIWSDGTEPATPAGSRLPFGVRLESYEAVHCDWWSWLFWMTTRLEEYGHSESDLDTFGRIQGHNTIAHREGWLARPEVEFRVLSWAKSSGIEYAQSAYKVIPTIDVDSAFAYKHRTLFMTIGAAGQDVLKRRWKRFFMRIKVLLWNRQDPYDTYDWLESQHERLGFRAIYFFLLADRGTNDRGISWMSRGLQAQIRSLMRTADIGIHPGFASHEAPSSAVMQTEIERLASISEAPVTRSRQHYLLQKPGSSWRRTAALGMQEDHSLGYADVPGFRAGMSRAFPAYDLQGEAMMNLVLHPIAAMDATFMRYLKVTPEEALEQVVNLASSVRDVGGTLRLLWHNESVSDEGEWQGWREMYRQMLQRIR